MSDNQTIAVITGAASGIGRASSLKLAENGATVVLVDFNKEAGEETLRMIKERGGDGIFVQADVTKTRGCSELCEQGS